MLEIFVVMKKGTSCYYLFKVVRQGFDVYCIPPHLGVHFSLHQSGRSHFTFDERTTSVAGEEPPLALVMGEAGKIVGQDIIRLSLGSAGRASCICTAVLSITSVSQDFVEFHRNPEKCFLIDAGLFPPSAEDLELGVWAVPVRNPAAFEFNNRGIPASMLYKATEWEPQIWIYARPF